MKKYSSYTDSGANWLGRVPSHWKLGRLGSYVSLRGEKGSDKVFEPLSVTKKGVVAQLENAAKTDDGENRKIVRKGDIAINGRSDRKGSSGLAEMDGSVSLINIVLKIDRGLHPKFAHHLIRSVAFQEEFYRWGRGIVADLWSTNYWDLKRIPTAIPPFEEQKAIASFIDSTLGDMDSAIESQERMIELLKERRSAIITQAVTKGLDPKAMMKDSSAPWLAEVNAEWAYAPLKSLVSIPIQNGLGESSSRSDPNDPRYIRITDIDSNGRLRADTFSSVPREDCAGSYVAHKDLLFAAVGGTVGKSYLHLEKDGDYCYAGYLVRVRPDVCKIEPAFLKFWAESRCFWSQVEANLVKVTIENFSASRYSRLFVPLPSLEKQQEIVRFLKKICEDLGSAITSQECLIELLKERRSAIITQAVTGQIDVR